MEQEAVLVVNGVREDGYRQHLGLWAGNTESEQSWSEVFAELKERGLTGVRYVVSNDHRGMRGRHVTVQARVPVLGAVRCFRQQVLLHRREARTHL